MEVITSHENVLKEPAPAIIIIELADSSINLGIRAWAENEHFFKVSSDILENGKVALDNAGITIPFPQREVTIVNKDK
jgi:small conductance mechanosensitive channel